METRKSSSPMGRPRGFDAEEALDKALRVFWEKGYEGASMADLTESMGINRPSLYAAFGNKESLFRRALERYLAGPGAYLEKALAAPTARQATVELLEGAVNVLGNPENPGGCLTIQGALVCGDEARAVKAGLLNLRGETLHAILERFERGKREGELPVEVDVEQLAHFICTVIHGMAVQSASGTSACILRKVADQAMSSWPA